MLYKLRERGLKRALVHEIGEVRRCCSNFSIINNLFNMERMNMLESSMRVHDRVR